MDRYTVEWQNPVKAYFRRRRQRSLYAKNVPAELHERNLHEITLFFGQLKAFLHLLPSHRCEHLRLTEGQALGLRSFAQAPLLSLETRIAEYEPFPHLLVRSHSPGDLPPTRSFLDWRVDQAYPLQFILSVSPRERPLDFLFTPIIPESTPELERLLYLPSRPEAQRILVGGGERILLRDQFTFLRKKMDIFLHYFHLGTLTDTAQLKEYQIYGANWRTIA